MTDRIPVQEFERHFIPKDFKVTTWESLKPFADDLLQREWKNADDYKQWLRDWDEYNVIMSEEYVLRYVATTVNTKDEEAEKSHAYWVNEIDTESSIIGNDLDQRFVTSPYNDEIKEQGFDLMLKRSKAGVELFREENVPLLAENTEKGLVHGKVTSDMTIQIDGEEIGMEQGDAILEGPDRAKREEAWRKMAERRLQDKDTLDQAFDDLVKLRHKIALNAGEKNYRDYQFREYDRFDYTPQDCYNFHKAIEVAIVPLAKKMAQRREEQMGLGKLRPWDMDCDPQGKPAIIAFNGSKELISKGIEMFDRTSKAGAYTLRRMQEKNLFDLDARKNKATNGYNYALLETRSSFMFTNQVGRVDDLITFVHEGGHATHDTLTYALNNAGYQDYPTEFAEVASMSMELLTHDEWGIFMPDEEICNRAKYDHLERIIKFFPYMAKVDAFQHAVYENPDMSIDDRHDVWDGLNKRFGYTDVDMTDINPEYERTAWQKKMHIYEVPLYYVEYGIAQLGALQVWRNSKKDKKVAVEQYENALSLGYTKPLPQLFETAGAKFDFSVNMVQDLMGFVGEEMDKVAPKIIQLV